MMMDENGSQLSKIFLNITNFEFPSYADISYRQVMPKVWFFREK